MANLISKCPVCSSKLHIQTLHCPECGLQLQNEFEISPFELLTEQQHRFLLTFLQKKGNLSAVQAQLGISYPTAKQMLNSLLSALHLEEATPENKEEINMENMKIDRTSSHASEIVKAKLYENGGRVMIPLLQGELCDVSANGDGVSFSSSKLPITPPYRYTVFDIIVSTLAAQGGRALKGNGRNYKLGEDGCDENTVVGAIGYRYANAETGKSVFDPVFVLAAILDWAGIAKNRRGYLELTPEYKKRIGLI
ncbi:MAG: DUF2089 family protein [Oscillospiraceae bacterium]|nr:DUF2089 family protein [Oscillospiraceae bacterium]